MPLKVTKDIEKLALKHFLDIKTFVMYKIYEKLRKDKVEAHNMIDNADLLTPYQIYFRYAAYPLFLSRILLPTVYRPAG